MSRIRVNPEHEEPSTVRSCQKRNIIIATGLLVLVILPIVLTEFPPSTDLPQHLAQIRLFLETLHEPSGPYIILWYGPDNLIYLFALLFWAIVPLAWVGRAVLVLIAVLWVAAIFFLGTKKQRPVEGMILASILVFNEAFYWGFLNFFIGFPVFILWFVLTTKTLKNSSWKLYLGLVGVSFLLYASHALWIVAGAAWFFYMNLLRRVPIKRFLVGMATLIPSCTLSLVWYSYLSEARTAAGYDVIPHWSVLFDRLSSLIDATSGGISGFLGMAAFLVLYGWMAFSIWQNRKGFSRLVDKEMFAAGMFFLIVVIIAPDKYMSTIFFNTRWFPVALIFFVLSLPAPVINSRAYLRSAAFVIAAAYFLLTTGVWKRYAVEDLSGFRESLGQLSISPRVLGLDLIKESDSIKGRPFLQLFAYAQVFKGGTLNFSFAEHYSGLVAYRGKREVPWTPRLEWFGERAKKEDFTFFDFVLVNGNDLNHRNMAAFAELSPLTHRGRWRAYKVRRPQGH